MRILQVCPRYYPYVGGVEEHVRNIGERLAKNHDVTVFTTDPYAKLPTKETINNVEIERFRSFAPSEAYYFSRDLKKQLNMVSDCYDIVHAHSYNAFPALYAAQTKKNNVLLFTSHYLEISRSVLRKLLHAPYKLVGRRIFEKSDAVICVSNYEKNLLMDRFTIADGKMHVLPNGVNKEELMKYNRKPSSHPKITYAGRLDRYQKNVDKIIQAFKLLVHDYDDLELVIIGQGPYENEMKKLVRKLELHDSVFLKHWIPRDEYLKEIASSSVFVLPSEFECYGIVAAEAMMLGVPTIVANSTALSEFVESGMAVGINSPITPEKISSAMGEALKIASEKKAFDFSSRFLSWDDVVERTTRLYKDILTS